MIHWLFALIVCYCAGRWSSNQVANAHNTLDIPPIPHSRDWIITFCILLNIVLYWCLGWSWGWLAAVVMTTYLVSLSWVDLKTFYLPDTLTSHLLWLGLFFNLFHHFTSLHDAILGVILGYGVLWLVYWVFKLWTDQEGLGLGDAKFLAAIGAWLGWQQLGPILLIGSALSLLAVIVMALNGTYQKGKPIAFGPGLAVAAWALLMCQAH